MAVSFNDNANLVDKPDSVLAPAVVPTVGEHLDRARDGAVALSFACENIDECRLAGA